MVLSGILPMKRSSPIDFCEKALAFCHLLCYYITAYWDREGFLHGV